MCSAAFYWILLLSPPCWADPVQPSVSFQEESTATNGKSDQKKEEPLSLTRQIAGYICLALLLIWMFRPKKESAYIEDEEDESFEEPVADSPVSEQSASPQSEDQSSKPS